jgi:hypothetical protein
MQSFLTEQQVSQRLNVSGATLRRWRLEKRGPMFVKVGVARALPSRRSRLVGGGAFDRRRSERRCGCRDDQSCGKLIVEAGNPAWKGSSIYKRGGHWHFDVTIHGVRYREALNTTDKRQGKELEKNRIAEIKQGKNASKLLEGAIGGWRLRPDCQHGNRRPPPHAETSESLECHFRGR